MTDRPERKAILVVEDNTDELMIYTTLLGFRGYAVLSAATYDEGLRLATTHPPDLAIVDVNLNDEQGRDGCDLVCALREDERTRHVPVIAHTAFGDLYHENLRLLGCASIIHKPSSPAALLEAIESLIGPAGAETAPDEAVLHVEKTAGPATGGRGEDPAPPGPGGTDAEVPISDPGAAGEDDGSA